MLLLEVNSAFETLRTISNRHLYETSCALSESHESLNQEQ